MPRFLEATRVQPICPCGNRDLLRATNSIIATLLEEQTIKAWGGFTYSYLNPPIFTGQFWYQPAPDTGQAPRWEEDQNVLIILDAPGLSLDEVLNYLSTFQEKVNSIYMQVGEPQKALWITAQPLSI